MIELDPGATQSGSRRTMTLPNFIIVAAGKSGTSSLARMLSRHPQVFLPKGEVHFFNNDAAYARGPEYYSSFFRGAGEAIAIGEKTPKYTQHFDMPYVAQRMYRVLGARVKLIWILRDPATRALSHYRHLLTANVPDRGHVFRGLRPKRFRDVIREEMAGDLKPLLVSRGYYIEQVQMFQEYFALDHMHFVIFEEFVTNPAPVLHELLSFLGVDRELAHQMPIEHHNASADRLPAPLLSSSSARLALLALQGRPVAKHQLCRSLVRKQIQICMTDEQVVTLSELRRHYAQKNRLLAEKIGVSVSGWV